MPTIFARILSGDIPADRVYEDDTCIAFRDVNPVAPVHILVIPRKPLAQLDAMTVADEPLVGHLLRVATLVAKQELLLLRLITQKNITDLKHIGTMEAN